MTFITAYILTIQYHLQTLMALDTSRGSDILRSHLLSLITLSRII